MVIIITGTSSGIGLTLATYFSQKGHKVYGLSRTKNIQNHFISIPTDITNVDEVKQALTTILKQENQIDVLINNAGMGMVGAVEDAKKEEIHALFSLNLMGSIQMISAVLPKMRVQKSGKIINISSIGSEMGLPFRGFYSASKAALDKVTEAMRYEVSPWEVQVCSVHLGDIKTNIADHRVASSISEAYQTTFTKVHQLMNAHVDKGSDPAEVALFLEKIIQKRKLKAHYYFGKLGQKLAIPLKKILPYSLFEFLMKKYNNID